MAWPIPLENQNWQARIRAVAKPVRIHCWKLANQCLDQRALQARRDWCPPTNHRHLRNPPMYWLPSLSTHPAASSRHLYFVLLACTAQSPERIENTKEQAYEMTRIEFEMCQRNGCSH